MAEATDRGAFPAPESRSAAPAPEGRSAAPAPGDQSAALAQTYRSAVPARLDRLPWARWHWIVVIGLKGFDQAAARGALCG